MSLLIQPSFAGGEISPDVFSRVDIAKYNVALRTSLNGFIRAQGGWSNRTGGEFIAPTKYQDRDAVLIGFQFNTVQTYELEFGDLYMRVLKDGGLVLEATKAITGITQANPAVVTINAHGYANGDWVYISGVLGMTQVNGKYYKIAGVTANTFQLNDIYGAVINSTGYTAYASGGTSGRVYEIATPYALADLPLLDYAQKNDVMTIVHPLYDPRELTRTAHNVWTLSVISFAPSLLGPTGVAVAATVATGTGFTVQRYVVTSVTAETFEESLIGIGAVSIQSNVTAITKANPGVITTSAVHNLVVNDRVYWTAPLGMTQFVSGLYLVNTTPSTTTLTLKSLAGVPVDTTAFGTYTSGGTVALDGVKNNLSTAGNYNSISWSSVVGAAKYYIYREVNGSGVYGYVGSATGTAFTDQNISADDTDTPPTARTPFSGVGNFPATVTYHEQRRVFGYTVNNPQTVYATQSGLYKNLNVSSPAQDDDAWTFAVDSDQVNAIRYLVSQNNLLVFTSGGEFVFKPGANGDTITPSSIAVKPESRYGSAQVKPVVIGKTVLFAESSQATAAKDNGYSVRDLGYTFATDDYNGNDLTILSRHLFEFDRLVVWSYAKRPYGILWGVREDGVLCAMTYLKEHEVWAWHRHTTDGDYVSISSIPENGEDATYYIVKRMINGSVRRYIERFHSRRFRNVEDAFFVDSGLTLDNWNTTATSFTLTGGTNWTVDESLTLTASGAYFDATNYAVGTVLFLRTKDRYGVIVDTARLQVTGYTSSTVLTVVPVALIPAGLRAVATTGLARTQTVITGLSHLEGKTVSILADGNVEEQTVVTSGQITLPNPVAKAHVGLPYDSDFRTLAIAGDVTKGSLLGQQVNVGKVQLIVQETRGIKIGPNENRLYNVPQRQFENWAEPTRLRTGVVETQCEGDWADGSFLVRQSDPLPLTILAVIPDVQIGRS